MFKGERGKKMTAVRAIGMGESNELTASADLLRSDSWCGAARAKDPAINQRAGVVDVQH